VLPEYQALWLQTLVYFTLACLVCRWQITKTRKRIIELNKNDNAQ